MTGVAPRALRDAFGKYMTGVAVITTRDVDGTPLGFTANSFTSVSLDPPLLLVCPGKFLSSYETFRTSQTFAVSVLAEAQEEISNTFASYKGDRFARTKHTLDCHDVPVISGAVATFSCQTHQVIEAGDHAVLIGQVIAFEAHNRPGLGYFSGSYFSLGLERKARDTEPGRHIVGAILQAGDTVLLDKTDTGYRPPQFDLQNRQGLSNDLATALAGRGVEATIGPVYSVFDDPTDGTHYAYLLTKTEGAKPNTLDAVSIDDLVTLTFTTEAIATMLQRFATEARAQDFTLYLGDAHKGGTHKMK